MMENTMSETKEPTELAVMETTALVPTVVFAPGGVTTLIERMEADVRAVRTDISTAKGRAAIKSLAYKVARSKTALDEMGKKLTDDARAKIDAVNADRRLVRDRLDALATEVRAPLTEWEDAEKARVAENEEAIAAMLRTASFAESEPASTVISDRIATLVDLHQRRWDLDFRAKAGDMFNSTKAFLDQCYREAVTREAEAAERARLRAEQEERDRQEAIRQQQEREARIAAEAAEAARLEAERAAAAAAAEAERRALAERAQIEAAARAAQETAEAERLAAERQAREAEQRAAEQEARARQAEADRAAAEARAEAERVAAAQRAEAARVEAERRAAREQEEAVLAERSRIAAEAALAEREAAARAADRAHRASVNRGIVAAMVALGVTEDQAKAVVSAIAKGEVANVSISY